MALLGQLRADAGQPAGGRRADAYRSGRQRSIPCRTAAAGGTGEVARQKAWPLTLRIQPGYDHSYYFIASFIEDHLRFHAQHLFG